jgi:thiamine transporter ThiT
VERVSEVTLTPVGLAICAFATGVVLGLYTGYFLGLFDSFVTDEYVGNPFAEDALDDALRAYIAKKRSL